MENTLTEDLVQRLSRIRALFKALCSRFGLARLALPAQYRPVGAAAAGARQGSGAGSGAGAREAAKGRPGEAAAEHIDLSF